MIQNILMETGPTAVYTMPYQTRHLLTWSLRKPLCGLKIIREIPFFGILDMGPGYALNLRGKLTACNGSTTFYIEGHGVPNSNTANWEYDYQGYIVPKWKNGIQQADACAGSVIRSKPHGNAKAGQTATFYLVKQ